MTRAAKWSSIEGGRAAFENSYAEAALVAALGQARLQATLDALGPPGQMRWDPFLGEIELRGEAFAAEQLGSFDGNSWMWSWANTHLNIPDDKTTLARSLRDRAGALGVPAFATAEISAPNDETLSYKLGALAIAHTPAEAYYIANQSQVYMFLPDQLDPTDTSPIDQLREAIAGVESGGLVESFAPAIAPAAKLLGLPVTTTARDIVIGSGRESIAVPITRDGRTLRTLGLAFVSKSTTIDDVALHLRQTRDLSELKFAKVDDATLELDQDGCTIRVTRSDRLRDVMRAANRTGDDAAKKFGAVITIATATVPNYRGATCAIGGGGFAGKMWIPTGAVDGEVVGPIYPYAAIAVCERMNQPGAVKHSFVFDCALAAPYPRT